MSDHFIILNKKTTFYHSMPTVKSVPPTLLISNVKGSPLLESNATKNMKSHIIINHTSKLNKKGKFCT